MQYKRSHAPLSLSLSSFITNRLGALAPISPAHPRGAPKRASSRNDHIPIVSALRAQRSVRPPLLKIPPSRFVQPPRPTALWTWSPSSEYSLRPVDRSHCLESSRHR